MLASETNSNVSTVKITVANSGAPVSEEDVKALEDLLNEYLGTSIDLPKAQNFESQEQLLAYAAGMLDALDELAVKLKLISSESGNITAEFEITAPNMAGDQVDSTRTATASPRTSASLMMELARVFAEIAATQSDAQALFALSSQQDIFNALSANLNAAEKKKEAAGKKLEADLALATAKIVEGAMGVAGGLIGAGGAKFKALEGIGQAVGGMGKIIGAAAFETVAAQANYDATILNVEAEKFQAFAQTHQSMGSRKEQTAGNLQQAINTLNQTLKALADAMNQTTMSIAGNLR
ncbi:MAG: hypothetical protein LBB26_02875 [Puniceicoccales bacterium]|nr:hypothetical protein [Puniceicoccales bacterium]